METVVWISAQAELHIWIGSIAQKNGVISEERQSVYFQSHLSKNKCDQSRLVLVCRRPSIRLYPEGRPYPG